MTHGALSHRLLALAVLSLACVLSACHSAPPNSRPAIATTPSTPPAELQPPATNENEVPAPNSDATKAVPEDVPSCACAENAPKPVLKRKPKPVPREPSPPPLEAAPLPPAPGEASVKLVEGASASILGKKVRGKDDEDLGRVVDILADAQGRVRIAIIEFGGFLGVGDRRIAVDWSLLKFPPGDADVPVLLNASKRALQQTPEYKGTERTQALMAPAAAAAPPPTGAPAAGTPAAAPK